MIDLVPTEVTVPLDVAETILSALSRFDDRLSSAEYEAMLYLHGRLYGPPPLPNDGPPVVPIPPLEPGAGRYVPFQNVPYPSPEAKIR